MGGYEKDEFLSAKIFVVIGVRCNQKALQPGGSEIKDAKGTSCNEWNLSEDTP